MFQICLQADIHITMETQATRIAAHTDVINFTVTPLNTSSSWPPPDGAARVPAGCVVLSVEPGDFVPWDNPDNLVSRELEQAVDRAVAIFFLPLLFIVR